MSKQGGVCDLTGMNVWEYNRNAWNVQSTEGCRWSTPFSDEEIRAAASGPWQVRLTPNRAVPQGWFPSFPRLDGLKILALASGGGQQVPLFAAAGADVVSYDASDVQLEKDEEVCRRLGLKVATHQGDMADMGRLAPDSFDVIFNPVSNCFARDLPPIWRECHRVLKTGGVLLCGMINPCFFLFDHEHLEETGEPLVAYPLPYSDLESLDPDFLEDQMLAELSLEFSHSWEAQLGGQCDAGFAITGFYEDDWDGESTRLQGWMPMFAATRSVKLPTGPVGGTGKTGQ